MSDRFDKYIPMYELLGRGEKAGKLMRLDTVKICYKLKKTWVDTPTLYIMGLIQNKTNPILLADPIALPYKNCNCELTHIANIPSKEYCTDMWMWIKNYESINDLINISSLFQIFEIPYGATVTTEAIECV